MLLDGFSLGRSVRRKPVVSSKPIAAPSALFHVDVGNARDSLRLTANPLILATLANPVQPSAAIQQVRLLKRFLGHAWCACVCSPDWSDGLGRGRQQSDSPSLSRSKELYEYVVAGDDVL